MMYSSALSVSALTFSRTSTASLASLSALAVFLSAAPAQAQVTSYNSLTDFNAATTSTLFDFNDIASDNALIQNPSLTPLTVTVVNNRNIDNNYYVAGMFYSGGIYRLNGINGTDTLLGGTSTSTAGQPQPTQSTTTFGFGSSVTAFATDFGFTGSIVPDSLGVRVQLFNGSTAVGSAFDFAGSRAFVALTSTEAFDRAVFTDTTPFSPRPQTVTYQTFDNLRVGPAAVPSFTAAPEPGSLALLLPVAGMTGLVIHKRKKSK